MRIQTMQTKPVNQPMQENLAMQIIGANWKGNIDFLKKSF